MLKSLDLFYLCLQYFCDRFEPLNALPLDLFIYWILIYFYSHFLCYHLIFVP